jgi:putative sporulation protein YtaF
MWHGLSVIWLALAVSVDGFGAGTTFGMRKVRIPFFSIMIIASCSGAVIYMAMLLGKGIARLFSPALMHEFGAILFMALGVIALGQAFRPQRDTGTRVVAQQSDSAQPTIWTFHLEKWGLVVQILKTPMAADMDASGTISGYEAVLLGAALSLDAFAAGLGAAFMGMSPLVVALVISLMSAACLRLGMWFGFMNAERAQFRWMGYVPGIFFIVLGLLRFF